MAEARDTVTILSIDGGGIRGIIPALVLAEIEAQTGRPVASLFDLIAGTSTGGLLALGLTKPDPEQRGRPHYSAAELAVLYEEEGPRIFRRTFWRKVRSVGNLIDEKYSSEGLRTVLEEYLQEARLREALTNVLIPAYALERREAFFFKSHRAREDERWDFLMREAAFATSAAPTYFEPGRLAAPEPPPYALIDGGVFATNPAMCAYAEARMLFPEVRRFLCVSLGTGEHTRPIPYEEASGWGVIEWARPLLDVVFHGINDTVDYQMQQIFTSSDLRVYYRFQVTLDIGSDDFDDASRTNLHALRELADRLLRERRADLETLCDRLKALRKT